MSTPWERLRQAVPRLAVMAAVAASALMVAAAFGLVWWTLQPGAVPPPPDAPGAGDAPALEPAALAPPLPPVAAENSAPSASAEPPQAEAALPPAAPPQPPAPLAPNPAPAAPAQPAAPASAPDLAPTPPGDRLAALRSFVTTFDGGECFFAVPIETSATSASIEAFAASSPPVEALDSRFREVSGFEAQIGFRPVEPPQCAAVDFVRNLDPSAAAPVVTMAAYNIRSGDTLTGTVAGTEGRSLAILLVEPDGKVRDLTDTLSQAGGAAHFQIILTSPPKSRAKPLLVIAIASDMPLARLAEDAPMADRTFPELAAEALRSGQRIAAALKYVKLEG